MNASDMDYNERDEYIDELDNFEDFDEGYGVDYGDEFSDFNDGEFW